MAADDRIVVRFYMANDGAYLFDPVALDRGDSQIRRAVPAPDADLAAATVPFTWKVYHLQTYCLAPPALFEQMGGTRRDTLRFLNDVLTYLCLMEPGS